MNKFIDAFGTGNTGAEKSSSGERNQDKDTRDQDLASGNTGTTKHLVVSENSDQSYTILTPKSLTMLPRPGPEGYFS